MEQPSPPNDGEREEEEIPVYRRPNVAEEFLDQEVTRIVNRVESISRTEGSRLKVITFPVDYTHGSHERALAQLRNKEPWKSQWTITHTPANTKWFQPYHVYEFRHCSQPAPKPWAIPSIFRSFSSS